MQSLLNEMSFQASQSSMKMKHSAMLTKNSKRKIICCENTNRTAFHCGSDRHINCSMHAEMAVLSRAVRRYLRGRKKKSCVL